AHEGPHSSSITAALSHLDASGLALTIGPMLLAAAIVAFGWARYRSSGDEAIVFCACVVASVVASPIVWSHYFTLLVIIPLVLGWRWQYQLLTLAATWLMGKPDGVGALSVLHPFPGSGWLWAGLAAVGAVIWHRRRPSAGHAGAVDDATLPANAGLCGQCVHALLRPTNRGTVYLRCGLAATDPRFPKYPRLPMLECAGFTVMSTGEAAAP
ncbi:MAG TPA: hypothetical protein VKB75_01255, partial [Jatrophihabitans sp.]|nr:hypothetical protein [Jatrophihabitans sp.]